jgi:hypothetical protein
MQDMNNDSVENIMLSSSAAKPKYKYMQNFQEDWYSTDTGMENFTL